VKLVARQTVETVRRRFCQNSCTRLKPGEIERARRGAFSVSQSEVSKVANYIAKQEDHHRKRSFAQEFEIFVKRYGLEWRNEENR